MGRKKKEIKLKEPVRIREKRLSDGNISLYLDMYHKGARKKEGLKLYLVPETTSAARMQNANTRKLAEQIKAQRILDIQQHGLVDWEGIKRSHITLSEWVDKYTAEECGLSKESMRSKRNAQARVEQYLIYIGRHDLALRDVDKDFCKGYIAFLKTCTFNNGKKTLSNTTCRIDQGCQRGTDRPQPLQTARCQGEAAEEQFDKGVPDHRGGEAAHGNSMPI